MFLTEDEFKILCGLKMGLNSKKIKEKFGIQIYTNDPRIGSLCKKYGVKDKWELIDAANMKKVEVFSQDEIPYYTYEKADDNKEVYTLVNKIKITKQDVQRLYKFIKTTPDDCEYELIFDEDFYNIYKFLTVKNLATGEKFEISTLVDGQDYTGKVKVNEKDEI